MVVWVCHCLILKKKSKHKKVVVVRRWRRKAKLVQWVQFMCYWARLVPRALSGSFPNNCAWSSSKRWKQLLALAPDSCLQHLHSCILWRCCRKHEQVIDFAKLACKSLRLNWTVVNLTPRCGSSVTETNTAWLCSHVGTALTHLGNLPTRVFPTENRAVVNPLPSVSNHR